MKKKLNDSTIWPKIYVSIQQYLKSKMFKTKNWYSMKEKKGRFCKSIINALIYFKSWILNESIQAILNNLLWTYFKKFWKDCKNCIFEKMNWMKLLKDINLHFLQGSSMIRYFTLNRFLYYNLKSNFWRRINPNNTKTKISKFMNSMSL